MARYNGGLNLVKEFTLVLSSMTGFARTEGQNDICSWSWEIKSVNAKGFDVRCRLGSGFDNLEPVIRERASGIFRRGNLSINLTSVKTQTAAAYQINQPTLDGIVALMPDLEARFGQLPAPNIADLLGMRGVLEAVEDSLSEDDKSALDAAVLADLDRALAALKLMRDGEGARLQAVLAAQLDTITRLQVEAGKLAALQPDALRQRLTDQLAEILDSVPALPEDRLAQEVALVVAKSDVREELDRLTSHEAAARDLLAGGGSVGRKLDFLCQEFNREANTLCSKSSDVELTRIGLDLKAVIEQFREQIQNIE